MSVRVRIPTPLQKLTQNHPEVDCAGKTVAEVLEDLERQFPGIKERICDEQGTVRRFVNLYVNEEDVRFLQGVATAVKTGDEVAIIPAIAGGGASGPSGRRSRADQSAPRAKEERGWRRVESPCSFRRN